ncbi:FAD-dependent oxidoreductase, partial [bacterium]
MGAAKSLPIIVIGAGPVGLAAAAHLLEKGEQPLVLEAGPTVAASVLSWGHVKLFSPWRYCIDESARRLLEKIGWTSPDPESWPTGHELAEGYLLPLAATPELAPSIRTGAKVVSVARFGLDKMKNAGRDAAPFVLAVEYGDGREETFLARAVVDASGTYTTPNPLGSSGIPALGERRAADRILYRIPDVHGADR